MATVNGPSGRTATRAPAPRWPTAAATAVVRSATGCRSAPARHLVGQSLAAEPHLGPPQDATHHLGLPPVELRAVPGVDQVVGTPGSRQDLGEGAVARDAVDALGRHHDGPAVAHDALGRGHALDRLVQIAVQRVAAIGRDHDVEGGIHVLGGRGAGPGAGGIVGHLERSGEDGRDLAGPVDGHVDREVRWGEPHRRPDEVVDRIPLPGDEGGPGVGDTARVVRFEDRRGGGQSGTHRLGPSAEAGEEVRLDEAGDDADVRLDVVAQQLDRHAVDLTDRHVIGAVRIVVDDGVAGHDVGSHQFFELRGGGLAVAPGGAQQGDGRIGNPAPLQVAQQRRQHRPVGHGPGQVGKDHDDPRRAARQPGQRRTGQGLVQGLAHGSGFVGQSGELGRQDDRRVIGDFDREAGAPVGQRDQHEPSSGPAAQRRRRPPGGTRWRRGPRWRRVRPGDGAGGTGAPPPDRG